MKNIFIKILNQIVVYYILRLYVNRLIHTTTDNDVWIKLTKINLLTNTATYYTGRYGYVDTIGTSIIYHDVKLLKMYNMYINYKNNGSSDIKYNEETCSYLPVDKTK